jgi:hypothetical protein
MPLGCESCGRLVGQRHATTCPNAGSWNTGTVFVSQCREWSDVEESMQVTIGNFTATVRGHQKGKALLRELKKSGVMA